MATREINCGTEKEKRLEALVSPDASYYLGVMHLTEKEKEFWGEGSHSKGNDEWFNAEDAIQGLASVGLAPFPVPRKCYFAFVPEDIPVGVVPDLAIPTDEFVAPDNPVVDSITGSATKVIGFGTFTGTKVSINAKTKYNPALSSKTENGYFAFEYDPQKVKLSDTLDIYGRLALGGNVLGKLNDTGVKGKSYFEIIKDAYTNPTLYDELVRDTLYKSLDEELTTTGSESSGSGRNRFSAVFNEVDEVSVQARSLYDEDYDQSVNVIAGNGRTLAQASDIWDQFRMGYHTYANVKEAFQKVYGVDPDDNGDMGEFLNIADTSEPLSQVRFKMIDEMITSDGFEAAMSKLKKLKEKNTVFKKFGDTGGTAEDEFNLVFGDFNAPIPESAANFRLIESGADTSVAIAGLEAKYKEGIEKSRTNFIDAGPEDNGLIDYFNTLLAQRVNALITTISESLRVSGIKETEIDTYINSIRSPKQLFLFIVGAFRNAMWTDPYARAWLVLKPNRKIKGQDEWDFNPVLKIFQAYIDPNTVYAKDKDKFRKLLAENRSEGNSSNTPWGQVAEDVDGFWDRNVGPLLSGIGDGLSALVGIFRMSMMQYGYGLSQVGKMSKQANIMNKLLNDSIYYSLGRPGSLLRAVDNPFTREYGEPVIEVREPFQKIHYLSSFSHILSNGIQENLAGVATSVTAVSDGKYPVTVAMDKSTPAERQVEKTVETGLYYDNANGSGLFGAIHPILHPMEFARGLSKLAQGTPDELMAKRVALAHLRESLKDIYGGEIIIIGNADIRPHDLVYLADVYERMYGMFEVEQVVHHFTSDLGFITAITPNALVSVNDPARWFMSSWIGTKFHMQALRNDTRLYMNSMTSSILASGQVSLDGLSTSLQTQLIGGLQYTHGSSALTRDIMGHFTQSGVEDINSQVNALVAKTSALETNQVDLGKYNLTGVGGVWATATGLGGTAGVIAAGAIPGAGLLLKSTGFALGGNIVGNALWKGWSWIRDNVLDQHGCYIQYLSQNGKAMDAGLSQVGQGMVVGRYHTKKLLPGILGVSQKVRTVEGYSYIRTDDLLKSLGWKELEVQSLVRYVSYENALVNSQVLRYSGISPEKAGMNRYFKVLCKVERIVDADTIDVIDILDTSANPKSFRVRFDGINAPELNVIKADVAVSNLEAKLASVSITNNKATFTTEVPHNFRLDDRGIINITSAPGNEQLEIADFAVKIGKVTEYTFEVSTTFANVSSTNISGVAKMASRSEAGYNANDKSPGGKATAFTQKALSKKVFIVRISPDSNKVIASISEADLDAGSTKNLPVNYEKDIYGIRSLGTIFYKAPQNIIESITTEANSLFVKHLTSRDSDLNSNLKNSFYEKVFENKFDMIIKAISSINDTDYFAQYSSSSLSGISLSRKKLYTNYVAARILQYLYDRVTEWPNIEWDEYYDDGTPVSLNWELVVNNLAKVYTVGLLIEQPSVISGDDYAAYPVRVKGD